MDIKKLIKETKNLPQIPAVIQKILEQLQQKDANPNAIAEQIAMDQSLSLKVIRLANSPAFGGNRNIASVKEAAARLGVNSLKTMVFTSGITSSIKTPENIDASQFWHNSFTCAGIARWISEQSPFDIDPEMAFTSGIVHNLGAIVIAICHPDEAELINAKVKQGEDRLSMEQHYLGFDHAEAGAALADFWHLPLETCNAIRHQHQPDKAGDNSLLASIMFLSNLIYRIKFIEGDHFGRDGFPLSSVSNLGLELPGLLELSKETEFIDDSFQALLGSS